MERVLRRHLLDGWNGRAVYRTTATTVVEWMSSLSVVLCDLPKAGLQMLVPGTRWCWRMLLDEGLTQHDGETLPRTAFPK